MPAQFNPAGKNYRDHGLGDTEYAKQHSGKHHNERGKFKVQSLRNIANTAPYMHNGVFESLEEVVSFYNTRDTDKKWGRPEITDNLNKEELGDLKLSKQEERDLVAFLKTLSDGYQKK
jgi:cytochrome c peroxidase